MFSYYSILILNTAIYNLNGRLSPYIDKPKCKNVIK